MLREKTVKDFKDIYLGLVFWGVFLVFFGFVNHTVKAMKEISKHCCLHPAICSVQAGIASGYSGVRRLWLSSLLSVE